VLPRNSWLLLLTAACACAQETANVSGKVTNSVTGAPIVRAHVTLSGAENYGVLTDGEGRYSIKGITPGNYRCMAAHAGFSNYRGGFGIDVKAGHENTVDFDLAPTASISGRVLDADREPVQLAQVTAVGAANDYPATTDNKGRYRIGGLPVGEYRVLANPATVAAAREMRTDGSQPVYHRVTYYPGVGAAKEALRVKVEAGADVSGIDVPLLTKTMVKVSGRILDIPADATGVAVEVDSDPTSNSSKGYSRPVGKGGTFEVWGLDPGKYRLRGQAADGLRSAAVEVEVGTTNIEHLEFRLLAPFDLTGRVEFEDNRAREAAKVEMGPPGFQRAVILNDSLVYGGGRTQIAEDESFHMEHLSPGIYQASVSLGHTFVQSARLGNVESDNSKIDLRNGSHGDSLILTLSANWAEISGTVSDANGPVAGAFVEFVQDRFNTGVQTDASGHYSLANVSPGTYHLLAGDERLNRDFLGVDDLEDYKEGLVTVEVHAGDKITQDLKQIRPPK
jgi:hypothetical protein